MRELDAGLHLQVAGAFTTIDWDGAYLEHAPPLLRYLTRLLRDPATAEDLMQTTFERAAAARNQPPAAELRPWLYRIASNLAIDHRRRARRMRFVMLVDRRADTRPPYDADGDLVRRALQRMHPREAVVLVLRLHEGFTREEIAAALGLTERQVKSCLARARESFAAAYRREESK